MKRVEPFYKPERVQISVYNLRELFASGFAQRLYHKLHLKRQPKVKTVFNTPQFDRRAVRVLRA